MVMTVLEARVVADNWTALRESYEANASVLPPGIVESFLIQDAGDATLWRIVTVWRNREALDRMRESGETPTGVLIFRSANAEPSLTIFDIRANPRAPADSRR